MATASSDPTTFAEAVAAVEHDALCASEPHTVTEYGFQHLDRAPCDCTRDARIAKGIEAALVAYVGSLGRYPDAAALAAFVEASRG